MKKMKKVLSVDDFAFMRRVVSDIINSDDRCEIVTTNRKEGLKKVEELL